MASRREVLIATGVIAAAGGAGIAAVGRRSEAEYVPRYERPDSVALLPDESGSDWPDDLERDDDFSPGWPRAFVGSDGEPFVRYRAWRYDDPEPAMVKFRSQQTIYAGHESEVAPGNGLPDTSFALSSVSERRDPFDDVHRHLCVFVTGSRVAHVQASDLERAVWYATDLYRDWADER